MDTDNWIQKQQLHELQSRLSVPNLTGHLTQLMLQTRTVLEVFTGNWSLHCYSLMIMAEPAKIEVTQQPKCTHVPRP